MVDRVTVIKYIMINANPDLRSAPQLAWLLEYVTLLLVARDVCSSAEGIKNFRKMVGELVRGGFPYNAIKKLILSRCQSDRISTHW